MLSVLRTSQRKPCLGPKEQLGETLSHNQHIYKVHPLPQQSRPLRLDCFFFLQTVVSRLQRSLTQTAAAVHTAAGREQK